MNDQFDRVVPVVAGDAHLVDHTLYKEQSPSSGRLHTFQLRLQIRRLPAPGRGRPTTPIGYSHPEVQILDEGQNHTNDRTSEDAPLFPWASTGVIAQ